MWLDTLPMIGTTLVVSTPIENSPLRRLKNQEEWMRPTKGGARYHPQPAPEPTFSINLKRQGVSCAQIRDR